MAMGVFMPLAVGAGDIPLKLKDTTFYVQAAAIDSVDVPLPPGTSSGEMVLAFVAYRGNFTLSKPTGWDQISNVKGSTSQYGRALAIYSRAIQPGDGTIPISFTSGSDSFIACLFRIAGWSEQPVAATSTSTSSTHDAPALTVPWTGKNTLWIASVGVLADSIQSYPSGWDQQDYRNLYPISLSNITLGKAVKFSKADTEDPSAFTIQGNGNGSSATVAIA